MEVQKFHKSLFEKIKNTCQYVYDNSKFVQLNITKIRDFINQNINLFANKPSWLEYHSDIKEFENDIETVISYVFVIDTLNFCFWPHNKEFEYGDLVSNVGKLLKSDINFFKSKNLMELTLQELKEKLYQNEEFPLLEERVRGLNELGYLIESQFSSKFENLLISNDFDLEKIVPLIAKEVTTFDDKTLYKGRQIFIYKRAQILAADLYHALSEKSNPILLKNVEKLTMFADYRIPQILREVDIFQYNDSLTQLIDNYGVILPGSEEEIEIRANTVICVEIFKDILKNDFNLNVLSIQIDYVLWNKGEELRKVIKPHHRTLSIFY